MTETEVQPELDCEGEGDCETEEHSELVCDNVAKEVTLALLEGLCVPLMVPLSVTLPDTLPLAVADCEALELDE